MQKDLRGSHCILLQSRIPSVSLLPRIVFPDDINITTRAAEFPRAMDALRGESRARVLALNIQFPPDLLKWVVPSLGKKSPAAIRSS